MLMKPIFLALLPFVFAARVQRLKLNKIPTVNDNPQLEAAYLAEKYGATLQPQAPLMGAGGSGRRVDRPARMGDDDLFWTQEQLKSGHGVPLTSTQRCLVPPFDFIRFPRLHECAVLC